MESIEDINTRFYNLDMLDMISEISNMSYRDLYALYQSSAPDGYEHISYQDKLWRSLVEIKRGRKYNDISDYNRLYNSSYTDWMDIYLSLNNVNRVNKNLQSEIKKDAGSILNDGILNNNTEMIEYAFSMRSLTEMNIKVATLTMFMVGCKSQTIIFFLNKLKYIIDVYTKRELSKVLAFSCASHNRLDILKYLVSEWDLYLYDGNVEKKLLDVATERGYEDIINYINESNDNFY
ncbi:Ankyrin-repeat protein [Orpheovirus IHUMI-LCC2]|uniref:Ankyrin-repeat protein n=1 Tax=Orpheovirus IHUMI-LCC2 TaxID=2023057 RepID=A0A2I2L3X8_9VIRU|nr:Ankyrin-repeat protein [Orpheovirus IHUMI-LCC2]SNW62246.1 Ankyrin-repeat protein [Orpheovirus IHUMI-LCC2]